MESVLNVNIFLSPWTKFRSRDYSKETSLVYFCIVLSGGPRGGSRGAAPHPQTPPPPIVYFPLFSTFPLFGVNRKGHKLFNPDFASDRGRNSMQCNLSRRSKQSFSRGSLHFSSNIKAWAGFDRQHKFVVPVSM